VTGAKILKTYKTFDTVRKVPVPRVRQIQGEDSIKKKVNKMII